MVRSYEAFMRIALEEAKTSLREGNNGFGAVIAAGDQVIARAHDGEKTEADPTSHAELNAIRLASRIPGVSFGDCVLVSTHEPCPMCATAIVWSGIKNLVYGYSISEAIAEGRNRINLTCREIFERAKSGVAVHEGVLRDHCSMLYRRDVRDEVKRLRGVGPEQLASLSRSLREKRIRWYYRHRDEFDQEHGDLLLRGYRLVLAKLDIEPDDAPVVERTPDRIVFHSKNFCPTLEACRILGLDTRVVCRQMSEEPTDALLKQLDARLEFRRNYDALRPYCDHCEEMIVLLPEC
ncbi:MAG: nucleoside deaminase [Ignavibacteriales bacterium]